MAEAKFTPGPWTACRTPASRYFDWTVEAGHGTGRVMQIGIDTDNTEADARLIAAAPELLEALREASDHLAEMYAKYQTKIGPFASQSQRINVKARAAIAKAEGGSHG